MPNSHEDILGAKMLNIPDDLRAIFPPSAFPAFEICRGRFIRANRLLETLTHFKHYRWTYLCPRGSPRYRDHEDAVFRLRSWRPYYFRVDPTLAPTPKLPALSLKFCIKEEVYNDYLARYDLHRDRFFAETQDQWLAAKKEVGRELDAAELGDEERHLLNEFWQGFVRNMEKWHAVILDYELPSWEEVVDDLCTVIRQRVEDGDACVNNIVVS
ncbi:hypothetical protein FE257_011337 [Aspergillus nanangensis]|uniref:Uncharacterized protein n=1 Tax=Aspergillus nanangensis TaxID=2582783 RepID=A0AAD4CHG7_ASPNN|nr:hypothetical protein FE257_011337 [Aspergillus nanangensis]